MLRLKRARIRGFKSLADVQLNIPDDLLLLIGQNGVGKSSILQVLALLREFARGQVAAFFETRDWHPLDVRHKSKALTSAILRYDLVLEDSLGVRLLWEIEWGLRTSRTMAERVWRLDHGKLIPLLRYSTSMGLRTENPQRSVKGLRPAGSVLSTVDTEEISADPILTELQTWASGIVSLELLSPAAMRRGARIHADDLGARGERLAGFLAGLEPARRAAVVERLGRYYPVSELSTVRKRAGWVDLTIAEKLSGVSIGLEHVSDGLLRLIAICSIPELKISASLVMLDEVEDGIEPHILPDVIADLRRETFAQLMLTSHSPILANYVEPSNVAVVSRDERGRTFAVKADELHTFQTPNNGFGAGELWINTSLKTLDRQAVEAHKRQLGSENDPLVQSVRRRFVETP